MWMRMRTRRGLLNQKWWSEGWTTSSPGMATCLWATSLASWVITCSSFAPTPTTSCTIILFNNNIKFMHEREWERECMIKSSQSRAEMQSRNMHASLQEYKFYIIWMRSKSILIKRKRRKVWCLPWTLSSKKSNTKTQRYQLHNWMKK